jgi:hypothetical protein
MGELMNCPKGTIALQSGEEVRTHAYRPADIMYSAQALWASDASLKVLRTFFIPHHLIQQIN